MARELQDIVAHLRACIADGSIKTTLIQTEDLEVLCSAALPDDETPLYHRLYAVARSDDPMPPHVRDLLFRAALTIGAERARRNAR